MEKLITTKDNVRIDKYLMELLNISRSKIQKMIEQQKVYLNGELAKNSMTLKLDDVIEYELLEEEQINAEAENIELDIVYEDDYLMVLNKANGMVVHPGAGNKSGTLVNALLYHSNKLSDLNGEFRPGIVHRIDAYTTGLLVVAKDNKTHEMLAKQLEDKTLKRTYIALVWGVINNTTGEIDAPIGRDPKNRQKQAVIKNNSKDAKTHFKVLKRFDKATLIEVNLETGRTHQIRVHMDYIGFPVVNDPVYGNRKLIDNTGQCLHAQKIGFYHPVNNEYKEFETDIPVKFKNLISFFEKE